MGRFVSWDGSNKDLHPGRVRAIVHEWVARVVITNHPHHQSSAQWGDNNYTPHQLVFGANGATIHPIKNQSGVAGPQTLQTPVVGAEQGIGVPLYSHSTITRTTAGPILSVDGSPQEGVSNVYIQNNSRIQIRA